MAKYIEVELPDGSVGEFPSSMSDMEISQAIQRTYKPKKQETFLQGVTRGPRNVGAALNKLVHRSANIPSGLASMMGDPESAKILEVLPGLDIDKLWGIPKNKHWTDILAQAGPEIAGAMLLPEANLGKAGQAIGKIPKAGKYLQKILSEGIPQAAYAGLMAPNQQRGESAATAGITQAPFSAASQMALSTKPYLQRLGSNLAGIAGGAATSYGLEQAGAPHSVSGGIGLAAGLLGKKAAGTKAMMMDELAGGIDPSISGPRLEAAKRLGLPFITPGEAGKSPALGEAQGKYGRTPGGSNLSYEQSKQRVAAEEKSIEKLLDTIYHPEKMKGKVAEGYKSIEPKRIPTELADELMSDDIIKSVQKDLESKSAYKQGLKGLPKDESGNVSRDTMGYWDNVKKVLDDRYSKAIGQGQNTQAHFIDQSRQKLITDLDNIHPEYADVRYLSEREQTRRKLENVFDRKEIKSGATFYNALNSKKKFNELMNNVREIPEAQKMLKDMKMLFADFSNPPSLKASLGASKMGMRQNRNAVSELKDVVGNMFTNDKFDIDAINFVTSPNWDKQLAEINKISDGQKKAAKTIEFFGRIAAQANAQKEREDKNAAR